MREGRLYRAAEKILGLLYPERCVFCDGTIWASDDGVCPECRGSVAETGDVVCAKCGRQIEDERAEFCPDCRRKSHSYDRGLTLYPYSDRVVRSIYRLKYKNRRRYAITYGRRMAARYGRQIKAWGVDALIPVPLHAARRRRRGYNQAELLAREIGGRLQLPVMTDIVARVRNTKPLKLLDGARRQDNLKNAFKICRYEVKLEAVLLIDDIYTTGSTIDEISRTLKGAGVSRVYFLTAAAGQA